MTNQTLNEVYSSSDYQTILILLKRLVDILDDKFDNDVGRNIIVQGSISNTRYAFECLYDNNSSNTIVDYTKWFESPRIGMLRSGENNTEAPCVLWYDKVWKVSTFIDKIAVDFTMTNIIIKQIDFKGGEA